MLVRAVRSRLGNGGFTPSRQGGQRIKDTEQVEALESAKTLIQERIAELYDHIGEQAEQIGLTDEQREKLYSDQFDGERAAAENALCK